MKKYLLLVLFFTLIFSCSEEKKSAKEGKFILNDEFPVQSEEKKEELSGGAKIYYDNCKVCHGTDGKKQLAGAKDLSVSIMTIEERIKNISFGKSTGKTSMPGFKSILSEHQIKEVAQYLDELKIK